MPITVILGAQWGMFSPFPAICPSFASSRCRIHLIILTKTSTGDEGVSIRGEPSIADHTQILTILRTQKGKLVDGQCQEAQLCARAAVSSTQAEFGLPTASISL
jgi:hypothetical protein